MKPFLTTKRKMFDLLVLILLNTFIFLVLGDWTAITLFSFGFIWNWSASQDLSSLFENPRYRYSMLKLVVNLQNLILSPVKNLPKAIHWVVKILPAGTFWLMVMLFNDSDLPWWMPFLGSLAFEVLQLEKTIFEKYKALRS